MIAALVFVVARRRLVLRYHRSCSPAASEWQHRCSSRVVATYTRERTQLARTEARRCGRKKEKTTSGERE
mgnify:CR=1 FL=1|jgi:hypothetical protein